MFQKLQKLLDRIESRIALWKILTGSGVVSIGAISAWIAKATEWIGAYGPIGWWTAGLLGALVACLLLLVIALVRYSWVSASAVNKWKQDVDTVNPLEREFTRNVLRPEDLSHPVTKKISNKRFVECRIIGPSTIGFENKTTLNNIILANCDIIVIKSNITPIHNIFVFDLCTFLDCEIANCTIYSSPGMVDQFQKMGSKFVTLTGVPEIDNPARR